MLIGCDECRKLTRRSFMKRTGAAAGALAMGDVLLRNVASTFASSAAGTGNLLVLCELEGGMDALSFLAPFTNSAYTSRRPNLALGAADVTPLPDNPDFGISNQCNFFSTLYAQGQLAVVQQVAYPNSNGSHFESQEIYRYGVRNLTSGAGTAASWYDRLREMYFDLPFGVLDARSVGDPRNYGYYDNTFRQAAKKAFGRLATLKTGRTAMQEKLLAKYRHIDEIGEEIRTRTESFTSVGAARGDFYRAAALASADLGTQILKVAYGGFDTHASQAAANQVIFPRVNNEFEQFVSDMQALGLWDRTTVVFYSEFGRRNEENGSPGTDHGFAGHMVLAGPGVNGGLHGQTVTTSDLNQAYLPYYVDFRAVFSACIRDWLGFDPDPIFNLPGEAFDSDVGSTLFS